MAFSDCLISLSIMSSVFIHGVANVLNEIFDIHTPGPFGCFWKTDCFYQLCFPGVTVDGAGKQLSLLGSMPQFLPLSVVPTCHLCSLLLAPFSCLLGLWRRFHVRFLPAFYTCQATLDFRLQISTPLFEQTRITYASLYSVSNC